MIGSDNFRQLPTTISILGSCCLLLSNIVLTSTRISAVTCHKTYSVDKFVGLTAFWIVGKDENSLAGVFCESYLSHRIA